MSALYRRFIRRVFHHFYREFAWTFDAVAWAVSGGLWFGWVRAALPEVRGRVLELGFGTGHLQLALAARPDVAGIDASPQMARIAARRLRRHGRAPRLVRGYAQALPFPAARFDTVVATFPSEYILDPATHQEIDRVLAPGGRLVIVPSAELDPGVYARAIDVVYRLALLAPVYRHPRAEPPPVPLRIAGMRLTRRWARVGPSQAMVLIGEREETAVEDLTPYAANH
ncbi:MAG: methyltransferase domain-containing protein [Oscillochloridaceae bacterium]|nr:methyltransferase domain-containing protein [Chloroflexaceae bacterium]MDW8389060.1 methyltransferase domain-containing protein [Oscillochloridaceae bacterium]